MKPQIKITNAELEFMLGYLPSYGAVDSAKRPMLARLIGLTLSKANDTFFSFPAILNLNTKVNCIKVIRTLTGMGLKEAKDAVEAETKFSLTAYGLSKEQVAAAIDSCSSIGYPAPEVHWS